MTERKNILTELVGKTIGGITRDERGGLIFWTTDPREGPLFTVAADSTFDDDGMFFDTDEVKDERK